MRKFFSAVLSVVTLGLVSSAPAAAPAAPARDAIADKTKLLKRLSNKKYKFRTLTSLMRKIGTTDKAYTTVLLGEIGARSAHRDATKYGLKTRVGNRARRRNFGY